MIKTLTLDGLTSVTIKKSAYDMARFCWVNNRSDSDIFMSCTDAHCTENADGVKRIPAGEHGMLDTESYETLYIKGSGMVNIETSPFAVCPFGEGKKGGGTSLSGSASYTINNAVDYPLLGLSLYGKSTQDGTPTPETPVDIVSVGDSGSVTITVDNGDSMSATAAITSALPLCGIPVDNGGNYTDSNGQQWICDELIYNADGTGKIVKHTSKYTFSGNENFVLRGNNNAYVYSINNLLIYKHYSGVRSVSDKYICAGTAFDSASAIKTLKIGENQFFYNEGFKTDNYVYFGSSCTTLEDFKSEIAGSTIIYPLAEPQEIELTAADVSALMQLRTYSGVTDISNSGNADMDVKYCTDKALSEYVLPITMGLQKQIDELRAAILSMGGNV